MEEKFIKSVLKREAGAIEKLYDSNAPKFLGICYRYCGNRQDAEDILHDGFIKIIQNLHTFEKRANGTFEAWMKRIIVNTSLNFIRDRMKEQKNIDIDPLIDKLNFTEEEESEPDLPYLSMDREDILAMVCELPTGYRTVFNMYVFEDYGHKEIADILGFTENTSKSQLSKARRLLRTRLNQLVKTEMTPTYEK